MWNAIPVVGWFVSLLLAISYAIPFWLIWTVFGVGEKYAYWLPSIYLHPAFWDCVGVFVCSQHYQDDICPAVYLVKQLG